MESELLPYEAQAHLSARQVLVIAPHPDDEIFGCGGAIALHRRTGVPVSVVILTGGEIFGDAGVRLQESIDAARFVGSPSVECWGLPDRGLACTEDLIQRMAKFIEGLGADLIYAPSPWEIHPDHRQASWLVTEALQRVRHGARLAFYEVGAPLRPNVLLDITPVRDSKVRAMEAFSSQQEHQDFSGQIQALNKYRTYSLPKSVEAVEAFWLLEPAQWSELANSGRWAHVSPGLTVAVDRAADLPLVSVLIRSVGRDQLYQALDSVALQTYPNIEVVVIAAKAEHPPLPSRCGPHPIRLIKTESALPRSRAANVALDQACGEFALFLDDDDWLMPSHIARLAEVLQGNPTARAAYTGVSAVDSQGQPMGQVFDIPFDALRLRMQNLMPIHAVLFRLAPVRGACRFDEGLSLYEDWDFWTQLSKLAPMVHLPGVSAVYRIHNSSGVHDAEGPALAAAGLLHRRWQSEISHDEFDGLVSRALEANALRHKAAGLEAEVLSIRAGLESTSAALAATQGELASKQAELASTQIALAVISGSLSWRVTRPLRRLSKLTGFGPILHTFVNRLAKVRSIRRSEGWAGVWRRVARRLGLPAVPDAYSYAEWLKKYSALTRGDLEAMRAESGGFNDRPLISVVMPVYNPPLKYLRAAVESVRAQVYTRWELCVCDDASTDPDVLAYLKKLATLDPRIKVKLRSTNGHISATSNDALAMAEGDWVALLDHDDLLAEDALYWVAKTLQSHADAGVIYSDEDKIGLDGKRCDPYFKPDWSPELLLSQNYISHLGVYRRSLVESVGGFRVGFEGAQDHDLVLRCTMHLEPKQVVHIPRVLYHWRVLPGSTALRGDEKGYANDAGLRAVADYLATSGLGGSVEPLPNGYYHVAPSLPILLPLVSLVIPTRNAHELVRMCVQSILSKTTYPNYEILLVDNGSDEPASLAYFRELSTHPRVRVIRDDREFNYSALNNAAISQASGEIVGLVNNDIEVISPGWLEEMVGLALRPGVGAVGARLWYPDETLQHAGVIVGVGGVAGHAHMRRSRGDGGYFGRAEVTQNYQVVTAACLLVRKSTLLGVGGLNEVQLKVAFNDVDFCMRLVEAGWRNVWTPFAEMYHHESATRGYEDTPAKRARFESEARYMIERWGHSLQSDPSYNPNLSLDDGQFALAFPPRVGTTAN